MGNYSNPCPLSLCPLCYAHKQVSSYPTSIASLAFSPQGNMLAVASSYMYEYGQQQQSQPDAIYIRPVQEGEVKPKPRKTAAPPA